MKALLLKPGDFPNRFDFGTITSTYQWGAMYMALPAERHRLILGVYSTLEHREKAFYYAGQNAIV